jgi:putative acyl-CoA dehydrogenase
MNWHTHDIFNQIPEHSNYNLFASDVALTEALDRTAAWSSEQLAAFGGRLGREETFALADAANRNPPILNAFDARGHRIDSVEFHPAWHAVLGMYREEGLVSLPFREQRQGRWPAWAAGFYMHAQIEYGSLCPATMTQASIPLLQREPALWEVLREKLFSDRYDPSDLPIAKKSSIWVGMGITEKQGGSDVRANTTAAVPVGEGGRGGEYKLRGHKWFFSAPMCDAHLVVARAADTDSFACFYVPRFRPDGSKNAVLVQRLKDKVGNRSNSSAEVEFQDAYGLLMGEEGRGIATIMEMATYTRLNCILGSAALLRQALVQALSYTRQRRAFGKKLIEHGLMRAVLVDLALESEAALALGMRLAEAFEQQDAGDRHLAWKRIMIPAAKFWVCKRSVELTAEAMEVLGGNGYVDQGIVARLFKEAPVNSIWEGSGNVMCLDVARALSREARLVEALISDLTDMSNGCSILTGEVSHLVRLIRLNPEMLESSARILSQQLVLIAQGCLLRRYSTPEISDAFIRTRLDDRRSGRVAGAIDVTNVDVNAVLSRSLAM